jgi:hypothetical protein
MTVSKKETLGQGVRAYHGLFSEGFLHERDGRFLPEHITAAQKVSELPGREALDRYYTMETGWNMANERVGIDIQLGYTMSFINELLNGTDIVERVAQQVMDSGAQNETINLLFSFRHENDLLQNGSRNMVALVYAHLLKDRLECYFAEHHEDRQLSFVAEPIYHFSRIERYHLSPFGKLAARSIFETPEPERVSGKTIILDDTSFTGMSLSEMAYALNPDQAEIIAFVTTIVHNGMEQLTIHPVVNEALKDAIRHNTGTNSDQPIHDMEALLEAIGYSEGLASLTNMEALFLIAQLYDLGEGQKVIEECWPHFNSESFWQTNEKTRVFGDEAWPKLIKDEFPETADQRADHILLRYLRRPKIDFYAELGKLESLAEDRVQQLMVEKDKPVEIRGVVA